MPAHGCEWPTQRKRSAIWRAIAEWRGFVANVSCCVIGADDSIGSALQSHDDVDDV